MHDKTALSEITRLLVDRHQCHAVVLYGSRAKGTDDPSSDWDVLGVRSEGPSIREALSLGDAWLDAFIHAEEHFEKLDEGSLRFLNGRVLVDQRGFAKRLLERIAAFEKQGPPPLADEAAVRAWYPKMLARIARGDIEARYRRAWLRFEALEAWFRLRGMWYRGPKESFAYLEAHEPQVHATFARALDPAATDDDLAALVATVLG
jgi:predicted nucleotidyltransferase